MERYTRFLHHQVEELIQDYGPLVTLWFDGEWEQPWTHQHGKDLYRHVRELQPGILVNNRVDKGRKGMHGTTTDRARFKGDYDTPEQRVGTFQPGWPWESCITLCRQWAWKPEDPLKSLEQCIHTLVNTVGGGGNLLLNVGPMPDGRIEPRQVERLRELGEWLETNGRALYGTRGGPFPPGDWGASTHRENEIYVHVLNWPPDKVNLPALPYTIVDSRLLNGGQVTVAQTPTGVEIESPPESSWDALDTIVVLTLDKPVGKP
jgi:alpha-L-fucosidase